MKFSIKDFLSKCDQIRSFQIRIFIFCAVIFGRFFYLVTSTRTASYYFKYLFVNNTLEIQWFVQKFVFFNFLKANFLAPKNDHCHNNQSVIGPWYVTNNKKRLDSLKVVPATFLLACFVSLKGSTCGKGKMFLFHFKSPFRSWDNQILNFQMLKYYDAIIYPSMKQQKHIPE